MKAELKAKFLQHLTKKKQDQGFTLIELLVVIIIIGILSAIALPSFLNQSAKAKQSEAKNTISSVNSAQTAYRTENSSFADNMDILALGLPTSTSNYTYTITRSDADQVVITAANTDSALKNYSGGNAKYQDANSQTAIAAVICENRAAGAGTATPPDTSGSTTVGATAATAIKCDSAYKDLSKE